MKKILRSLAAVLLTATATIAVSAAPTPKGSVAGLLGFRPGSDSYLQSGGPVSNGMNYLSPLSAKSENTEAEGEVTICGSVVFPDNVYGIWSYGTESWNPTRLTGVSDQILATGGGFVAGDYYYCNTFIEMLGMVKTYSYKMSDWSVYDDYTADISCLATTMAYNKLRDEVYGCFVNSDATGYQLAEWNYSYYRVNKVICDLERPWSGCAYSKDGTLYAIERNGDLYTVNTKTGAMTLVGSTGVVSEYAGDAIIDTNTDTMYWCVANEDSSALYSVNIATASATKLYDLVNKEQICGMYIPEPAIPAGAPAKISSVSLGFNGTSLSGNVSFSTPRNNVAGEALPAETMLQYSIKANGVEIATGEAVPYKSMRVPVEFTAPGSYYITVTVSNEAGTSAPTGAKKFIGPDTPKAPTFTGFTLNGNDVKINWSSVSSSGVNNGSVATSSATYTLTRYPGAVVLVDNQNVRTYTDNIPTPAERTDYYYTIKVTSGGLTSAETKSNVLSLGPVVPPFEAEFNTSTSIAGWSFTGKDGAASKWTYYSYDKALRAYGSTGFDDWAFSPEVIVESGSSYPVSFNIKTNNYYEEKFDICWGTAPTAEAMTNVILADQTMKSSTAQDYTGEINVVQGGRIYIGVHAKTEGKSNAIYLLKMSIAEGRLVGVPAAVTDFKADSPVDGTVEATVEFTLPAKNLGGDDLTGSYAISSVTILRDGEPLATLDGTAQALTPGAKMTYSDKSETLTAGKHTYGVYVSNAVGNGNTVEAEIVVGARKPVAPASATMLEDGNTGMVTVTWEPVTTDIYGNTFKPEAVKYRVVDRQYNTVADNVEGTSITVRAVEEGEQAFTQFGVYAVTAGGESEKLAGTAYKPVGEPYAAPWSESFKDRQIKSIFGYNYIKDSEPWQFVSTTDWGFSSSDDDGGLAYFEAYGGVCTALVTGKINLDGVYNPALTYYTYNYQGSSVPTNTIDVEVDCGDGNGFVAVQSNVVAETGPANTWNKVLVPLSDYEGKAVVIRFVPRNASLAFYTLDNLRVSSYVETNLAVTAIKAPTVADVNREFEIEVSVANTGELAIPSYTVELMRDGNQVAYTECPRLEPNQTKTVLFPQTLTATDSDNSVYQAVVVCSVDLLEEDNTSEEITVSANKPLVPGVTTLAAVQKGDDVELTWSAPDMASMPAEPYTETFENAESWAKVVDGWKIVDADKAPVGGIQISSFPIVGLSGWFVVDGASPVFDNVKEDVGRWSGHSGDKYLASEYVQAGGTPCQSDDWMISPALYGGPQTIQFYAKSFDPEYLEEFEVLYSATTTDIEAFTSLGGARDVPNAWTLYRYRLPQGAKYFAIRSRSTNKFFLFVDDVTYIPAGGEPAAVELKGYNVYRNGNKVNTELVAEPRYTDLKPALEFEHSYFVTAVYDKGESGRGNEVRISLVSGIGQTAGAAVHIGAARGCIVVTGLADGAVTVSAVDGRAVRSVTATGAVRIAVEPGLYIVTAGNVTAKVVVK